MASLAEEIGRITTLLEDAHEEGDWTIVKKLIEDLDAVYEKLETQETGFSYDYD
jgi:hypothetical protein